MDIDVILATYNRCGLLGRAIESLLEATVPPDCTVRLIVVDNNSNDGTRQVVERAASGSALEILYLFEPTQGKIHALNLGIGRSRSDIIAYFDDDEVVDANWLCVMRRQFEDPEVDFIGGPYYPDWSGEPPPWLPRGSWSGVLGIVDNGAARRRYGSLGFGAMLIGGNCAIRREKLLNCGPYLPKYERAEDRYMYERLLETGAIGYYVPELIIFHYIHEDRLSKRYFRNWVYTEGKNEATKSLESPIEGSTFRRVPRWMWRLLLRSTFQYVIQHAALRPNSPEAFSAELQIVRFAGFYRTRNLAATKDKCVDRS